MKTNRRRQLTGLALPLCINALLTQESRAWILSPISSLTAASHRPSHAISGLGHCRSPAPIQDPSRLHSASDVSSSTIETSNPSSPRQIVASHLSAAFRSDGDGSDSARIEMSRAELALLSWIDSHRRMKSDRCHDSPDEECRDASVEEVEKPDAEVFSEVIRGLLALRESVLDSWSPTEEQSVGSDEMMGSHPNSDVQDDADTMDRLRSIVGKSKRKKNASMVESKSERATRLLDLMESIHEPLGSIYDDVISSHCRDALDYLSLHQQISNSNDYANPTDGFVTGGGYFNNYYNLAYKSAKQSLALLNRSEELYRETGEQASRLPSVSSYVAVGDVWKALAVAAREMGEERKRLEGYLDVVRGLHGRRLEVYSLDNEQSSSAAVGGNSASGSAERATNENYNILSVEKTSSVQEVLEFAANLLHKADPSYHLPLPTDAIGTWHFNQLIFDLSRRPQPFSGPLAQDLLEFMVRMVRLSSPTQQSPKPQSSESTAPTFEQSDKANPIVPKPNTDTINGVLKAWMVTPTQASSAASNNAHRAEAVLAQIAIWQSEGTLWGVSPDVVSYNTVIACWKESGIRGSAGRATEILNLLEANSTNVKPDVISYASAIGAWAESSADDATAGRKAEEILTRMYWRSKEDPSLPRPNTRCFNAVLLAYANGREEGGGKRALELLRFMERLHAEGYVNVRPDSYTLNIVMKALTNCGEVGAAKKANEILRRMETSYTLGDTRLEPDLRSYNTVLDAFAKKGDALSAEALLKQMYAKPGGNARPNAHSYTAVLSAWARNEDKIMAVKRAEELFNDLESKYANGETDVRADTSIYNALINVWAKSGDRKALYRVTQLLDLMEELGLQGGDETIMPNTVSYCSVLDCLARSKNWKAYNESLKILNRMEELYAEGYESVRPCARAYSIVISTIARSRKKGKAIKAQEILHRMESEYRKGNIAARPSVYSYNAVINAAAYTTKGDEREQEDAFKVACLTFDQLRMSDYLKPSHVSYGTFLKAIQTLMPSSDVRDNLVTSVFRRCCRDGQVGTLVLRSMKQLASPELYQTLLKGESNYDLPKSWSVNVKETGVPSGAMSVVA